MVFIPYTGKICSTIPALVLSYLLFIPFFIFTAQKLLRPGRFFVRKNALFFSGILLFVLLILITAHPLQYTYLIQWTRWMNYSVDYFDSKLAVILIANMPPLWCIFVLLCIKNPVEVENFSIGAMRGILACASLILFKLAFHIPDFLSTDPQTFVNFYSGISSKTICITGSAPILSAATAICFIFLRKAINRQEDKSRILLLFITCAVLMVHLFWIRQRFDCIFCLLLLFLFSAYSSISKKRAQDITLYLSLLLTVSLILWISTAPLHWDYWKCLIYQPAFACQQRTEALMIYAHTFMHATNMPGTSINFSSLCLSNKGLGSFALVDTYRKYPHNILLETLYEVGIGGFLLLSFYTCWALFDASKTLLKKQKPLSLCHALNCLIFLGHAFKSGDLSYLGVYFFSITLVYCVSKKIPKPSIAHH